MAYVGQWRRSQSSTPPQLRNPNLGAGVRADHLTPVEPGDPFDEPTPSLPPTPAYLYAQDDFMLPYTVLVADPVITEPLSHEYGGADRDESTYAAHMADHGAAAVHHHGDAIERAAADAYVTQRVEMEFPSTGSRAALTRGRNAWPENNPDGPPAQGHHVMRWIDRQYTRRGITPDMAPIRPYTAASAPDTPAPAAGQATQYTSPFAALALARRLKLSTPQVRRVPRPPDESAVTDGTEDRQYTEPAYWQGW